MITERESHKFLREWKDWLSGGTLVPVFQPILSSESTGIYGYELLGRLSTPEGLLSLGDFFLSQTFGYDEIFFLKKKVDEEIRFAAIQRFADEAPAETKLFLNISPNVMYHALLQLETALPQTIQMVREVGVDPERIVIEITEERFPHNLELLRPVLNLYRQEGFSIAVDDAGSEASNLDRIGLFHPEIIKVDLQMLRRSTFSRNFKEILLNLSKLGESLGSSLLFEGIESEDELYNALNYGARYIQGFYFAKPQTEFAKRFDYRMEMQSSLEYFHARKQGEMNRQIEWENVWKDKLSEIMMGFTEENGIWEWKGGFETNVFGDGNFFRMYITNPLGFQVSPNYSRDHSGTGTMAPDYSFLGKNWSFRPYFFEHLHKSKTSRDAWTLSQMYHDISERMMLRTFARNLSENLILFIDVVVSRS
ncbi:EAL domain-containing protein [Leptospira noumeaensis]|uniref:EAL domain-containing protein n=1 Tax=Leptospira noumeaensis TaxID=2484964 RepID=A0A4V3JKN7_9LEPT|nr:EAL domain-containing protein [Leptospira noumeaensis]TGK87112.1 EAL domain-containing protein [Leptospira noumeaensis]